MKMTLQIKEKTKGKGHGWGETEPSVRRSEGALKVRISQEKRGKDTGAYSIEECFSSNCCSHAGSAVIPGPGRFLEVLCCTCASAGERQDRWRENHLNDMNLKHNTWL